MSQVGLTKIALLSAYSIVAVFTFSWGTAAHSVIGQIADKYIENNTRDSLQFLLGTQTLADAEIYENAQKSIVKKPITSQLQPMHFSSSLGSNVSAFVRSVEEQNFPNLYTELVADEAILKGGKYSKEE